MLVAGNWKMNGTLETAVALSRDVVGGTNGCKADVLLCPPSVYLQAVVNCCSGSGVRVGGQNADWHDSGAYTGEVSVPMLAELGCTHVLAGHSERRALFAETNDIVARKVRAALDAGVTPVLCVGETLMERERDDTEQVVEGQVKAALAGCEPAEMAGVIIAYEPVWAIGTGESATPGEAQAVHRFLRTLTAELAGGELATQQILYGGSVNAENAAELFAEVDIDGALVGGASLSAEAFVEICRQADVASAGA